MSEAAAKLGRKIKSGKLFEIVVVVILILVVAVIVFTTLTDRETSGEISGDSADYVQELETRLSKVLSKMEGAGEVSVFVTVASEGEKVLAMETVEREDGTVTTTPILSGGEPIVLEELMPEITGVLIVAEGANDLNVRFNLLEAAASVLNINQSIIKVYTMGGNS